VNRAWAEGSGVPVVSLEAEYSVKARCEGKVGGDGKGLSREGCR
jgi:hypothetical protein